MYDDKSVWNPDHVTIFGPQQPMYYPDDKWPNIRPNSPTITKETEDNIKKPIDQKNAALANNTPVKADNNKTDWSLMPFEAVEDINKVLEFGAKKYSANNWRTGSGFKYTRILNSLLRHIFAYMRGEDKDPESGLSHLAHAGCNIIFLLYYDKYKTKFTNDDRV